MKTLNSPTKLTRSHQRNHVRLHVQWPASGHKARPENGRGRQSIQEALARDDQQAGAGRPRLLRHRRRDAREARPHSDAPARLPRPAAALLPPAHRLGLWPPRAERREDLHCPDAREGSLQRPSARLLQEREGRRGPGGAQ